MYEWQTVGEDRYQLVLSCKKIESPERMRQMRILGLDFGSRTVGVAVSDGLLLTAQGVETIERKDENKLRKTAARIEELVKEYESTTSVR